MANTNELKYSKSHEWVRYEGDEAYIGITDFAQSSMGDLVFVNLPEVDDEIEVGEALGDIESVKAVEDVLSPVSATVLEVNEELLDAPEAINEHPYGSFALETSQRPKSCWMRKRTISLLKKKKRKKSL